MFKRRRNKKTNYKKRLGLLKSGIPRAVVRKGSKIIKIQFIEYNPSGDITISETTSDEIEKAGWLYSKSNIPAAYLTGLAAGLKALSLNIKETIPDFGLQTLHKKGVMFAALKGILDSGIAINISEDVIPKESRLKGNDIAEYAKKLKVENSDLYNKQFSGYLKKNTNPESIVSIFDSTKERIIKQKGVLKVNA